MAHRSGFDDTDREQELDRRLEREGGYRTQREPALLRGAGTTRSLIEGAGILQPPVKLGGAS